MLVCLVFGLSDPSLCFIDEPCAVTSLLASSFTFLFFQDAKVSNQKIAEQGAGDLVLELDLVCLRIKQWFASEICQPRSSQTCELFLWHDPKFAPSRKDEM